MTNQDIPDCEHLRAILADILHEHLAELEGRGKGKEEPDT